MGKACCDHGDSPDFGVGGTNIVTRMLESVGGDDDAMSDKKDKAAECCRQAKFCLDVAERTSIREDRERMMELAREWLALAEEIEGEED